MDVSRMDVRNAEWIWLGQRQNKDKEGQGREKRGGIVSKDVHMYVCRSCIVNGALARS